MEVSSQPHAAPFLSLYLLNRRQRTLQSQSGQEEKIFVLVLEYKRQYHPACMIVIILTMLS